MSNDSSQLRIAGVVLAAGKGTRMQSDLPKVLHEIFGKSLLQHIVDALNAASVSPICIVLSSELERFSQFRKDNEGLNLCLCLQLERRGTADALAATAAAFVDIRKPHYSSGKLIFGIPRKVDRILVCAGDTPALRGEDLRQFVEASEASKAKLSVIGMRAKDPKGYGRLICNDKNQLLKIVEEKDCTPEQRSIDLCNSGVIYGHAEFLFDCLNEVKVNPITQEYYLTDCIEIARRRGAQVSVYEASEYRNFEGVNDCEQLTKLSTWMSESRKGSK